MVGIRHLETPISFTLLPATLTVKSNHKHNVYLLTHLFCTLV
jgi:hypothetical protein